MLSKGYTIALANRVCTWYKGNVVSIYKRKFKLIIMKVVLKSRQMEQLHGLCVVNSMQKLYVVQRSNSKHLCEQKVD